jgi:hypothetical protein
VGFAVEHAIPLLDGGLADGLSQVTFAGARRTSFHGEAWEFFRNDALDARGYFESPGQPKGPYKQNQFGATLGGPIKEDKAFFFVDYEGTRIHQDQTDTVSVPTMVGADTSNERTGDFSGILGPQSSVCGADGASLCLDARGRPVFSNEIYDPSTTRTVAGSMVRDGFRFDPVSIRGNNIACPKMG